MENILSLLGKHFTCPHCGRKHYIPTRRVLIQRDAFALLPSFISSLIGGVNVLLLCDNITYEVAGRKSQEILKNSHNVSLKVLYPTDSPRVYAEERYLGDILREAEGKEAIITLGTGTITDLGKYAANKLNLPAVSLPTAPSMNAYTSGVAAFLSREGLKVTVPVNPPVGVLADTEIISGAPLDLIKAGFADSLAKAFANADWKISSFLTGERFCPLPLEIVTEIESKFIQQGDKIINRDDKVIAYLMEGLILGGFSMVIAGKSSPASGGEHLISHFLDMEAHERGIPPYAYHGIQVGLGVLIVSRLYDTLKAFSAQEVERRLKKRQVNYQERSKFLELEFPAVKEVFKKKIPLLEELPAKLPGLWEKIKEEVFPFLYSHKEIEEYLRKAECPLRFSEIGVNRELARKAILQARFIRDRLTVLDIADELGILEPDNLCSFS
ncbi:MAG: sn-glycerol-1-phosphate dehydrogenase [Caldiserica bacterium]|nr:sn-glycerol-1-phosphate dehydrogenase [Caldisericota bacterium]